jgi:hypothetical protein
MKKTIYLAPNRRNRRIADKAKASGKKHVAAIVLMSSPVVIHTVTAVLDMPNAYGDRKQRCEEIITAVTGNTYVTVPAPVLTQTNTDYVAYSTAASSSIKESTFRLINNDLKGIMSLFQSAANDDPANAETIVLSGKFKVKKITLNQKHEFELHNGILSGTIHLNAPGGGSYTCHDWEYSPDGITFTKMTPTIPAETDMIGLTPGEYAHFRHRLITKDGPEGWSQVEKIMVN